jgi:hypothetical protein
MIGVDWRSEIENFVPQDTAFADTGKVTGNFRGNFSVTAGVPNYARERATLCGEDRVFAEYGLAYRLPSIFDFSSAKKNLVNRFTRRQ